MIPNVISLIIISTSSCLACTLKTFISTLLHHPKASRLACLIQDINIVPYHLWNGEVPDHKFWWAGTDLEGIYNKYLSVNRKRNVLKPNFLTFNNRPMKGRQRGIWGNEPCDFSPLQNCLSEWMRYLASVSLSFSWLILSIILFWQMMASWIFIFDLCSQKSSVG